MTKSMEGFTILLLSFSSLVFILNTTNATDTITAAQFIKDGETIISSGGSFEMGFFSPGNSKNRYLGMWYKKIPMTVVWVANRYFPLTDTSGVLKVINQGILALVNGTNNTVWSTNYTSRSANNLVAQLLDSGNLVVRDANDDNQEENFLWQSFDYPSDTLLPGMKLGKNFVSGLERHLSSWKSTNDPSPGIYTYQCDPTGYPQNVMKTNSMKSFRTGAWNGLGFSGVPNLKLNNIFRFGLVYNKEEVYYGYELLNSSVVSRLTLNHSGIIQRWSWPLNRTQDWVLLRAVPVDTCDSYSLCGAYGSCNSANSPICECLDKFQAKYPEDWADTAGWSKGCVRMTPLNCDQGDGFLKYSHVKLPDTQNSWFSESMNLRECKSECLKNCTCMAYTNLNISRGSGCLLWFGDLIDVREFPEHGQDIFIRMASSELGKSKRGKIMTISLSSLLGLVLLGLILIGYVLEKSKKNLLQRSEGKLGQDYTNQNEKDDIELPLFSLATLINATNNFSINNKLGEGGFGPVYKGVLEGGREIAVKRHSTTSEQGLKEFKNEALCIVKLQHRNLVKLIGCCVEGIEKILIYEYMPHKSLDSFIFDEIRSRLLDWPIRFQIINGIARGLMYLHQDSRLRIIHRDLKASNILLDSDMNPKISDFGVAKMFGGNETEANTNQVVGTHGYISPEYANEGIFSVKSDVYSFGVLVLEIVTGKRNRGFLHCGHQNNLLGHTWRLLKEGKSLELVDAPIEDSCGLSEVLRSIQVGLLCVQHCPEDRPNMSNVVWMLAGEGVLPQPKQPGVFTERIVHEAECSKNTSLTCSINDITITGLDGR